MADCEICTAPLGPGADEGACRSCLAAGAQWAHRHIVRLWNRGLTRGELADELGYTPASITTTVIRLRRHGELLDRRLPQSTLDAIEARRATTQDIVAARAPALAAVTTSDEETRR